MENQKTSSFKNLVDIRVLLGRIESEMSMWSKGYEEILPRRLDQFLRLFHKAITLDDAETKEKLQSMIHQLERLQSALLCSEPVDHQLAQNMARQIIEDIHKLRRARTSMLKLVEVEDAVGAHVICRNYALSTVGQIVRFCPASREKRAFGFIGKVVIRPADELKTMEDLVQGIYLSHHDETFSSDLYHWPADFPRLTFQEPGRPSDLLTLEWANHQVQDDDEDEEWEEEATSMPEEIPIVKTIKEGDRHIGMRVFSIREEASGHLDSIEIYADGAERWAAIGVDGKKMIDESNLFWLEISQYRQLFPARVLELDAITQKLLDALQLYEEKADLDDHDEIIQHQRQLDGILKFLNGDMEDELQRRITEVYQQMLWSSSLNKVPREEVARQTVAQIDRLRQNEEKS